MPVNAIADYSTYPLISPLLWARLQPEGIEVTWGDQRRSPFHYLWLRDNCPCSACVYSVTREQVFEVADVPIDLTAQHTDVDEQGALRVVWQDGHESRFDPGWLRAHAYDAASRAERRAARPRQQRWTAGFELPLFEYQAVMEDEQALLDWLLALRDAGLTQVRGVPTEPGSLSHLARRIAFIRESNFGVLFNVQSKADADSNAYTAFNLPLHTDLPTRELQPGLQFLHCLINDASGGDSLFVDGFAVAEALHQEAPQAYRLLCEVPVEFRNKDRRSDYRCEAPVIARDAWDEVTEIRLANFLRGPFNTEPDVMLPFYRAYRRFIEMTRETRFQFRQRLEAGQLWCFDNRRILHARDAFDPASGARHFQGCYVDRDELLSRIRVLQR
ncbi:MULTISPECIES: gamma-butyrobetaine dioxygenase [unclassified Pseudomonas]|uniref:gamma-butyrobetaine dioxygenase n=1 Tax=unclassified Pseudomonas TaxID=196821 RepID=UPI000D3837BF|nr:MULTISPECIES: gamma-butyrobetaine dioxygenase [unclassified Pseudomonas]RAU45074.1 gamma-butyrobetaine dioxygenase [Pseudomonas sp. RIT 409]RAU51476.1 gamma-butyrobetaine dioxygenase [Pseudomonas sp. RIT 412]